MYKIKSTGKLKEIMQTYFDAVGETQTDNKPRPLAWCTSVGPAELLRAFGFEVYFPENHGALLGATRTANNFIPSAVNEGFSDMICSYLTGDIGSFINDDTPLTKHYRLNKIPRPDILVYNTNQCREVEDWFTYYGDHFKCPCIGIHSPRHLDKVTKNDIGYVASQFREMIPVCEQILTTKFDIDKFKETVQLSKDASLLWQKVLKTSRTSPAPISFFDGTIHMGIIVVLRGTKVAVEYYKILLDELEKNIQSGQGIVEKEECRIFWEGMPIWGKLRMLSDFFIQNNTSVVASTYCNSWIFDSFDEKNPFESTALAYTQIFINRSEKAKLNLLKSWLEEYHIKGIIYHDSKTCFNNSNCRFRLPVRLKELTGIPFLVLEGDLCDLRFFSEGQSITKLETFLEQIT
jgi:benzoyl-CoA reductase/2-hydroxyglutaryl-CoA dehydratase subunit BcrC/BadD/HgdB